MSDISFRWTRDHTTDDNKAKLREFPREIRLNVAGNRVLLCHGSPTSNTEYLFENRSDGYLRKFTPGGKHDAPRQDAPRQGAMQCAREPCSPTSAKPPRSATSASTRAGGHRHSAAQRTEIYLYHTCQRVGPEQGPEKGEKAS